MSKLNTLTGKQVFELNKWIEKSAPTLDGMTRETIAKKAGTELGFTVTISNVASSIEATGAIIRRASGSPIGGKGGDRTRAVANELRNLLESLGHPISPVLKAICEGRGFEHLL